MHLDPCADCSSSPLLPNVFGDNNAHWRALCPWHSLLFCDNPPFKLHLCLVAIISCLVILIFWHYTFFRFKWHVLEMCIAAGYVSTIFSVNKDLCTLVMQHSEMLSFVRGCILVCHLFLNKCRTWMPVIFTCLFPSTFSSLSSSFWQSTFGEKQKSLLPPITLELPPFLRPVR